VPEPLRAAAVPAEGPGARTALSIQVHPDRPQARAGFCAQQGRPGSRTYADDWPKPELLYALTPFEVLAGFREPHDAAGALHALDLGQLRPVSATLRAPGGTGCLREALRAILMWPEPDRPDLLEAVVQACRGVAASGSAHAAACDAVVRMAADHPGDIGLLASLLLRHRLLAPGEALYMPAGGLHAYIAGTGLELLANSDSVLRAGLTSKHVNIPELLRIVDPAADVPVLRPRPLASTPGGVVFDSPAPEFRLYRFALGPAPAELPVTGPRISLCLAGRASLRDEHGCTLTLQTGQSCFLPAADGW